MTILSAHQPSTPSSYLDPKWILDGNPDGYLFWRRKSGGASDHSMIIKNIGHRVKFKHDVQVVEFLKPDYEDQHDHEDDSSSEFTDECGFTSCDVDSDSASILLSSLCVAVMFLILTYQCLF